MIVLVLLTLITLFVAYANGANDNFKGVATLYGASLVDYKKALIIATIATFAGCLASVYIAEGLIKAFSGKGLVPDTLTASPIFLLAVATGAGATVILATWLGFPISTTHSLTGALIATFGWPDVLQESRLHVPPLRPHDTNIWPSDSSSGVQRQAFKQPYIVST